MADLASLLEGTTPHDLSPLDVSDLARRARRRERRKRAAVGAACVLVVVAVATAAVSAISRPERDAGDVQAKWAGPGGEPLDEPVGSWAQADDPPFSPRRDAFGTTLSDGRVLVWGGHDGDVWTADGGIYDPSTGDWELIPTGPLPAGSLDRQEWVQLADDRLAFSSVSESVSAGLSVDTVIYDVDQGRWLRVPTFHLPADSAESAGSDVQIVLASTGLEVAWDGEVLALLIGYGEPTMWRWRIGDEAWQPGAPPHWSVRSAAGTAFDGRRLAVWGGSWGDDVRADGAIYDVAADTWETVPAAPISGGESPTVMWFNDRLVVSLSTMGAPLPRDRFEDVGSLAVYDPVSGDWDVIPPPPGFLVGGGEQYTPSGGFSHLVWSYGRTSVARSAEFVVSANDFDRRGRWFWQGGEWERAPLPDLRRLGSLTIALSDWDPEGFGEVAVLVRDPRGQWLAGAEAPLGRRSGTTIVVTGDKLVVVGGWNEDEDELAGDAWVFDLAG